MNGTRALYVKPRVTRVGTRGEASGLLVDMLLREAENRRILTAALKDAVALLDQSLTGKSSWSREDSIKLEAARFYSLGM